MAVGQAQATVYVNKFPIPTAQISIFAFVDQNPINNAWDETEPGLGGCKITLKDDLGPVSQDAFGNPLGTTYTVNPDGTFVVKMMGNGAPTTLTQEDFNAGGDKNPYNLQVGEALVKYLPPGKYGVVLTPPPAADNGQPMTFAQTTTIEGTPTIDAWVKANEPTIFVEGFGTGFKHVAFGFFKTSPLTPSIYKGQL